MDATQSAAIIATLGAAPAKGLGRKRSLAAVRARLGFDASAFAEVMRSCNRDGWLVLHRDDMNQLTGKIESVDGNQLVEPVAE